MVYLPKDWTQDANRTVPGCYIKLQILFKSAPEDLICRLVFFVFLNSNKWESSENFNIFLSLLPSLESTRYQIWFYPKIKLLEYISGQLITQHSWLHFKIHFQSSMQSSFHFFLYISIAFHNVYISHIHYPFISWKTFNFFPFPSYCE